MTELTKIDVAIRDMRTLLDIVNDNLSRLNERREVLLEQVIHLQKIRDNKRIPYAIDKPMKQDNA